MNLDRCWTRRIFTLRLCGIEEIDSSSSSWKTSTSRRWWSDWILENQRRSSETFPALSSLVWRQVEEKHGRRRRKQETMPGLYWFVRSNLVPPSSSRSFRTQSHWSYFTGQCCYSEQLLPVHLSCRMCNQFTFHHQFGIDTWRSNFEQQTDSVLSACGSHGQKPQGSRYDRLECTASCTINAWSLEETSEYGLLGRHQTCSEGRVEVLSNTIERIHSSRNTSSLLYSESCLDGQWRSHIRESISVTSASSKDIFETWLEKRIGFRTCSTQRPEGQVVKHSKSSQSSQPNPNPDHDRTGKPVVGRDASHAQGYEQSMLNEVDIAFRILGLPHSVVKQAENSRVRELVEKISRTTQIDNLFNEIYNKTEPTTRSVRRQSKWFRTLATWSCLNCSRRTLRRSAKHAYHTGVLVHGTCGHFLKENCGQSRFIEKTLDLLSIPNYVIKKGRPHGHRCWKPPEKKEYHLAHNLKKRCIKRRVTGIHDCFLRDHFFVNVCSNMIEMKKFLLNGTILQSKISLITWRNLNIFRLTKLVAHSQ